MCLCVWYGLLVKVFWAKSEGRAIISWFESFDFLREARAFLVFAPVVFPRLFFNGKNVNNDTYHMTNLPLRKSLNFVMIYFNVMSFCGSCFRASQGWTFTTWGNRRLAIKIRDLNWYFIREYIWNILHSWQMKPVKVTLSSSLRLINLNQLYRLLNREKCSLKYFPYLLLPLWSLNLQVVSEG